MAEQIGRESVALTMCLFRWLAEAQPTRDELRDFVAGTADGAAVLDISPELWTEYERRVMGVQNDLVEMFHKHDIDTAEIEQPSDMPNSSEQAADQLYMLSQRLDGLPRERWPECGLTDGNIDIPSARRGEDVKCNWFMLTLCGGVTFVAAALSGGGWPAVWAMGGPYCICSHCQGPGLDEMCGYGDDHDRR